MLTFLIGGCGISSKKQEQLRQQQIQDSIQVVNERFEEARLKAKQAKRDSINRIEEKIALSDINFLISESEFNWRKKSFLNKTKHKLGEYKIARFDGLFDKNKLYWIQLKGEEILYDEYEYSMKKQYQSLMNILRQKYQNPTKVKALPKWNKMNKGDYENCASWEFGEKEIDVWISCSGANYTLDLVVQRRDISDKKQKENQKKKTESNKKAVDLL